MEKVYRLLSWLDINQAVDWLQDLTATNLSEADLLALCSSRQCAVHTFAHGVVGCDGDQEVVASGVQRIMTPLELTQAKDDVVTLELDGPVIAPCHDQDEDEYWAVWYADVSRRDFRLIFKPADIEALATKMNGASEHAAEVEALRQELEQERAMRQVIESELRERCAQDGTTNLGAIRQMLAHPPAEFAAMRERAEKAEFMVALLDKQITEQAERQQLNDKAFKEMAMQLRALQTGRQPAPKPKSTATGLTFPYGTKELEAARDAALAFWCDSDPERPPLQKQVSGFMVARGVPARQAIELAIAIKPDGQKKA